ncbi:unnamed protein product [Trichogramma brassicae]|uniref:Uncharacterized protein n=1 Tax=Trichogramma brassicae TaxID=86971 RepID=A0A6H5IRD5_9HYME|nr:unnamed protein product [Trichogramma brassicae]
MKRRRREDYSDDEIASYSSSYSSSSETTPERSRKRRHKRSKHGSRKRERHVSRRRHRHDDSRSHDHGGRHRRTRSRSRSRSDSSQSSRGSEKPPKTTAKHQKTGNTRPGRGRKNRGHWAGTEVNRPRKHTVAPAAHRGKDRITNAVNRSNIKRRRAADTNTPSVAPLKVFFEIKTLKFVLIDLKSGGLHVIIEEEALHTIKTELHLQYNSRTIASLLFYLCVTSRSAHICRLTLTYRHRAQVKHKSLIFSGGGCSGGGKSAQRKTRLSSLSDCSCRAGACCST